MGNIGLGGKPSDHNRGFLCQVARSHLILYRGLIDVPREAFAELDTAIHRKYWRYSEGGHGKDKNYFLYRETERRRLEMRPTLSLEQSA
jgi:hypothetical protein